MAKAVNEKRIDELTDQEREEREEKHRQKHADLDKMIEKQRRKAERMERINPTLQDEYVLTPEEIEDIEKDLPEEFDDTHIDRELKKRKIDVKARKEKVREDKRKLKQQIDEQAKADAARSTGDAAALPPQ